MRNDSPQTPVRLQDSCVVSSLLISSKKFVYISYWVLLLCPSRAPRFTSSCRQYVRENNYLNTTRLSIRLIHPNTCLLSCFFIISRPPQAPWFNRHDETRRREKAMKFLVMPPSRFPSYFISFTSKRTLSTFFPKHGHLFLNRCCI